MHLALVHLSMGHVQVSRTACSTVRAPAHAVLGAEHTAAMPDAVPRPPRIAGCSTAADTAGFLILYHW